LKNGLPKASASPYIKVNSSIAFANERKRRNICKDQYPKIPTPAD
jgi:hypothetical protein